MGYGHVDYDELLEITDNPDQVFLGNITSDLFNYEDQLIEKICSVKGCGAGTPFQKCPYLEHAQSGEFQFF